MHRKSIPTTYDEARAALKGRESRTIANNTTLVDLAVEGIGLRLHATNVVTFRPDGALVLRSGGWRTTTTKDRINRVIRAHGWSVYAQARVWHVARGNRAAFKFSDGFTIPPASREPHQPSTDARVENHGTIFLVRPLTEPALAWLTDHTDGTWFGNALAVEPRYVTDLVAGMREHGLTVEAA